MRRTWVIAAYVSGKVRFPEHPDHVGAWGLCGGEDLVASRASFRSVGEAMTWARKVLDGEVNPRYEAAGEFLFPFDTPTFDEARVVVADRYGNALREWVAGADDWRVLENGRLGEIVRTDS